jgi:hypothetical protein
MCVVKRGTFVDELPDHLGVGDPDLYDLLEAERDRASSGGEDGIVAHYVHTYLYADT